MVNAISGQIGQSFQQELKEVATGLEDRLSGLLTAVQSDKPNNYGAIAVSLANLVSVDKKPNLKIARALGDIFTGLANQLKEKQEQAIVSLGLNLKMPHPRSIRKWTDTDAQPLNGYEAQKEENYFVLTVNDIDYTVEVYRDHQTNAMQVDESGEQDFSQDAHEIQGVSSVGNYSMQDLQATDMGKVILEKVYELAKDTFGENS